MSYFVTYDLTTGDFRGGGSCAAADVPLQATEGTGVVLSATQPIVAQTNAQGTTLTVDLTGVGLYLRNKVDQEAGELRSRFITDVPGQAQTYEKKEAEARRWTSGDETANPAYYPFMITEAAVRGVPVAQVRGEIMGQVSQLVPLAALVEAHRVSAKLNVMAASPNIVTMVAAANVNWEGLLTP